jgi:hypothetical protein
LTIHCFLSCISCCMPATRYLCKLMELDMVFATIDAAIKAPPTIDYHIQCYHMETRHYTVKTK